MKPSLRRALLGSALAFLPSTQALAAADGAAEPGSEEIIVTGALHQSSSATGLPLTLRETPQSVTIIDRERIDNFALTNINDLLDQTVGINVDRVETDRTYFNARGFDITNFQVDGIGLPLLWGIQFGDVDTILFDRVETVRGANAIMTGIGNPSATVNYIRKRPTEELDVRAALQAGRWDRRRAEADVSVPLSSTAAARIVYAHEERDTHLAYNHVNRDVFGAIVDWNITPELTATAGYTHQDNDADGVLWGALPLVYSDGTRIDYESSATPSADWTYWDVTDQTAFAELNYTFAGGWQAKAIVTYKRFEEDAKLLYAFNYPDAATGLGVGGSSGLYPTTRDQYLGDVYASGPVKAFGREHNLAFGLSTAKSDALEYEGSTTDAIAFPAVQDWGDAQVPEPSYSDTILSADYSDRLTRLYGAAHLNLADSLKAVIGASAMWLESEGDSYGVDQAREDSKISPYAGIVFDVTPNVSLYASYTDIYNPQVEVDVTNRRLDPAKGTSIEGGIKSEWLGGRLYAAASVFRAKQKGLAEFAGTFGPGDPGQAGDSYYEGVDTTSTGFEIELAGRITDNWTLNGGYTNLDIEDEAGEPTRTFIPTETLKLATTYSVPEANDLRLGAQLRWQNAISTVIAGVPEAAGDVVFEQDSYAVVDLMAGIRLIDGLRATVNVRNVGDKKYLSSLKWDQAFYAAPRSVIFTLSYDY